MRRSTRSSKRSAAVLGAADAAAAAIAPEPDAQNAQQRKKAKKQSPPAWIESRFSAERRAQWIAFLRAQCFVHVGADFFDVFELAYSISRKQPLEAFADALGLELCGPFELLARASRGESEARVAQPLFLHGRFFVDPPEVMTVLQDAARSAESGAHWGYFRDAPDQVPEFVVVAADSAKCAFTIAGSSLFHVLAARVKERRRSAASEQLTRLEAKVAEYVQWKGLSGETPAALSRKRSSKATAASLHGLSIVVPCDAKKDTGYRELPVVGEQLAALFARVVAGDAGARKSLSGLLTRATIANDECDFGTSLLLGLDLFTVGSALEKESLQLLKVAYMLLRRGEFAKVAVAQAAQRRVLEQQVDAGATTGGISSHMLCSFAPSHVADSEPKPTCIPFP